MKNVIEMPKQSKNTGTNSVKLLAKLFIGFYLVILFIMLAWSTSCSNDDKEPVAGKDGMSCTVEQLTDKTIVTCGASTVTIPHGKDGAKGDTGAAGQKGEKGETGVAGNDGKDGKNGQDVEAIIIDPCPEATTPHAEIILRIGTQYVAYFEQSGQRRLTVLLPGTTYQTTDGRGSNCQFTVPLKD